MPKRRTNEDARQSADDGSNGEATTDVSVEAIAQRAHQLFEERGESHGNDLDDWLRAEADLRSRQDRNTR